MMMGGMMFKMFWMILGGLVFLALLAALVVLLVRLLNRQQIGVPLPSRHQETTSGYHQGEVWSPGASAESHEDHPPDSPLRYEQPLVQYPHTQDLPR